MILATHRDLAAEVEAGRFRKDLFYRIHVVTIELPPLRERIGDLPLLVDYFLLKYVEKTSKPIEGVTREALERMQRYLWPGNIRELENAVERAVVLCRKSLVDVDDLPPALTQGQPAAAELVASAAGKTLYQALDEPEKQIIQAALAANGGSRKATARQLGINRTTLYKKMHRLGLLGR